MLQIAGANELLEDVHKRDLCIGCGACAELCPYFKNYKGKTSQLFPCTLEQGRCYAYRKDLIPVARVETHWKDIAGFATSKYISAPTLSAVNVAKHQGYQRIGVVGTPRQMVAVAQMRFNAIQKVEHTVPIALSIGLFCNWSLDTRQLTALLSERLNLSEIERMDIPPPPASLMRLETRRNKDSAASYR